MSQFAKNFYDKMNNDQDFQLKAQEVLFDLLVVDFVNPNLVEELREMVENAEEEDN